jgi:steroid delta-isomerase-like uncharacterized protein
MKQTDFKAVARNFYESYNGKDMNKAFDDYIVPDLINHTMGGAFTRGQWLQFDNDFLTACPDLRLTVKEQFAEGKRVVTHWICNGKHTGNFMGMAPSGNSIQLEGISIDTIEDGKIKEHFAMADFTQFLQQFTK